MRSAQVVCAARRSAYVVWNPVQFSTAYPAPGSTWRRRRRRGTESGTFPGILTDTVQEQQEEDERGGGEAEAALESHCRKKHSWIVSVSRTSIVPGTLRPQYKYVPMIRPQTRIEGFVNVGRFLAATTSSPTTKRNRRLTTSETKRLNVVAVVMYGRIRTYGAGPGRNQ